MYRHILQYAPGSLLYACMCGILAYTHIYVYLYIYIYIYIYRYKYRHILHYAPNSHLIQILTSQL